MPQQIETERTQPEEVKPQQAQPDRFKAEMPQIPGVSSGIGQPSLASNPAVRLVAGLVVLLLVFFLVSKLFSRPKHTEPVIAAAPPQIDVPAPAPDPTAAMPLSTESDPDIATVGDMAKPWSSRDFFFVDRATGENVPALLIRLPGGSATQSEGYWALALKAPFGNCQLEYVSDVEKLKIEYDFRAAKHPMVGNPCSRTVFDPVKMASVQGNVWVRGAIVQGSDLRPPLGIEVKIQGKNILAVRME